MGEEKVFFFFFQFQNTAIILNTLNSEQRVILTAELKKRGIKWAHVRSFVWSSLSAQYSKAQWTELIRSAVTEAQHHLKAEVFANKHN